MRLDGAELTRREPSIRGLGAPIVKATGIVDFRLVSEAMGRVVGARGQIELGVEVTANITVSSPQRIRSSEVSFIQFRTLTFPS